MNILTFDIEEWFHILDNQSTKTEHSWLNNETRIHRNMDTIFALLDKHKVSATFFCLGWIARKFPEVIREIDKRGFEIGTHSDLHQLAYEQNREEYTEDLKQSIGDLEDITGKKVRIYRAPGFSIKKQNQWALEVLIENGIEVDCSIFPASRAHGGFGEFSSSSPCIIDINGKKMKEFPINLATWLSKKVIFSGGGYFRFFPYPLIKRWMKQSEYVMAYFHPRDFDPHQPVIKELSIYRKFKSYYGLHKCEHKLDQLLTDFAFTDVKTLDENTDWSKVDVVHL